MAELSERVLALAGLAQALAQVRRIADTGQANASALQTSLDSVFRIDASSPSAVYGNTAQLRPGLVLVQDYFSSRIKDEHLPRLGLAVLQLERRFVRDGEMTDKVLRGIREQADNAQRLGSAHPDVIAALGTLYADTLSHLRPRVLVQGNPHYLGQPGVVAEVRAVLLAAVRSAVLWRQLGGSYWDLVLRKRAMVDSIDARLD